MRKKTNIYTILLMAILMIATFVVANNTNNTNNTSNTSNTSETEQHWNTINLHRKCRFFLCLFKKREFYLHNSEKCSTFADKIHTRHELEK